MNIITLDQYRAMLKRNILTEPKMLVCNQTRPLGQIVFQCPGDNFQLKDITIPDNRNAIDLTQFAPLENLLACSRLKALLDSQMLVLLNPDDMPEPVQDIVAPSLSKQIEAGALSVDGTTISNAAVIVEQNGNVWTGTSNGAGVFTIDVSGLVEGAFFITVTAVGFAPTRFQFAVAPQSSQTLPAPTIHAVFKETTVSGNTVANANIVVSVQSKEFTGQADDNGEFTVNVDPLPFGTIYVTIEAQGYVSRQVDVVVDSIPGLAQIDATAFLSTDLSGKASPNAEVEVLIDGQSNQFTTADASGNWTAVVPAIKGAVSVRSLEVEGYDEATATMQPTKRDFGTITVDNADAFGENTTTVTGVIAGLSQDANDISAVLTVQAGTYEGTVDLTTGVFTINGVDAKTGVGSTGVVTVQSAFYNEGSAAFSILEEFAQPTLQQSIDGQTSVVGDTSPSTAVKITMNGETKTASSNPQGAFIVDGFTNVVPGSITVELTRAGYLPAAFNPVLAVRAHGELDADLRAGEDTATGIATPGSNVTLTQASVGGDAVADAVTGEFLITLSGTLVDGQAQLDVKHAGYVDFTDTLVVTTA